MSKIEISVVAPAYNEEKHISSFLRSVIGYLDKLAITYEVLIVENGSTDRTSEIVRNFLNKNSHVRLITLPNPAYGIAIKKGLSAAHGKYIVLFNIDFFDLAFIDLCLIDLIGKDLIIGSKLAPWASDRRPLSRHLISLVFNFFLRRVFGFSGTDTHGIKVFRAQFLKDAIVKSQTTSGIADTEIAILLEWSGAKIAEVPVTVAEIRPARFKSRFFQTFKDIYDLTKSLWPRRPQN